MTLGSLFAGVGGFDLGFERAGFKTIWQCEIDKAAQGVLRRHFPDANLHSDVCQVGAHNLEPVDVVTFGSPCQDLSVAGKRAGLAGGRSGLFHEAARVIRELRERYGKPDFAIWENVPGAFSSNEGRDFAAVVQAMVDIGARDVAWRVLDSRYFGVAQRRRRVFLVADFGGERAEQVLFEPESLRGDTAKGRKARKEAPAGIGAGAAGGGESFRILRTDEYRADTVASTVSARDYKSATDLVVPFDTTQITSPSNYSSPKAGDPCHPLAAGAHPPAIAFAQPIAFHPTQDPISSQDGISHAMAYAPAMQIRRLTVRECESLQGFPQNWTAAARLLDDTIKPQADGPRYKQLGNAVTVNVAEWIARRVAATLAP